MRPNCIRRTKFMHTLICNLEISFLATRVRLARAQIAIVCLRVPCKAIAGCGSVEFELTNLFKISKVAICLKISIAQVNRTRFNAPRALLYHTACTSRVRLLLRLISLIRLLVVMDRFVVGGGLHWFDAAALCMRMIHTDTRISTHRWFVIRGVRMIRRHQSR
jgi:hypothetical protein